MYQRQLKLSFSSSMCVMVFPKTFFAERNPFIWQQIAAYHWYIILRKSTNISSYLKYLILYCRRIARRISTAEVDNNTPRLGPATDSDVVGILSMYRYAGHIGWISGVLLQHKRPLRARISLNARVFTHSCALQYWIYVLRIVMRHKTCKFIKYVIPQ